MPDAYTFFLAIGVMLTAIAILIGQAFGSKQ